MGWARALPRTGGETGREKRLAYSHETPPGASLPISRTYRLGPRPQARQPWPCSGNARLPSCLPLSPKHVWPAQGAQLSLAVPPAGKGTERSGLSAGHPHIPVNAPSEQAQCPAKPAGYSPVSFRNPQPATQQVWAARGGPALNCGRQPGPMRCPQATGGVTFRRAMSLASEMGEYFS